MSRRGVSDRTSKAPIRRIVTTVKEIKVETMGITTNMVTMFEMETITATTTSTGVKYSNRNDRIRIYAPP